jgi:uracil DNA glycosylase
VTLTSNLSVYSLTFEKEFKILPPKALFDNLEQQGVLFLNATLTVQKNKVDSHTKYWKEFMEELIKFIDSKQNIKWLLWGDKAQNRILPIIDKNNAVCAVHPRIASFVEQNCFKEITSIRWDGM